MKQSSPRSLPALLGNGSNIFHGVLFEMAHLGRLSDLAVRVLSGWGEDELRLRAILLVGGQYLGLCGKRDQKKKKLDYPITIEVGIKESQVAVGFEVSGIAPSFSLSDIEKNVKRAEPTNPLERMILDLCRYSDSVAFGLSAKTGEVRVLVSFRVKGRADRETPSCSGVDFFQIEAEKISSGMTVEYHSFGELDFMPFLKEEKRAFKQAPEKKSKWPSFAKRLRGEKKITQTEPALLKTSSVSLHEPHPEHNLPAFLNATKIESEFAPIRWASGNDWTLKLEKAQERSSQLERENESLRAEVLNRPKGDDHLSTIERLEAESQKLKDHLVTLYEFGKKMRSEVKRLQEELEANTGKKPGQE